MQRPLGFHPLLPLKAFWGSVHCLVNKSRAAGIIYLSNSSQLPISAVRPAWLCHIEPPDTLPQAICSEAPADGRGGPLLGCFFPPPPPLHSFTPSSGSCRADMKVNFPMNSLEGKAWLGLGAPDKAEWLPSCLGGQDGQWPKVVEGWVLKRMVRKGT